MTATTKPWKRYLLHLRSAVPALCLLAALIAPFVLEGFTLYQLTKVAVYAMAILGLNLLTGYNGQFSLGHSAFYAVGAYVTAILMTTSGFTPYLAIPIAGLAAGLAGYLFGLPALRLEPLYLALATFGLAVATPQLVKSSHLEDLTGGVQGISLTRPEAPFGLPLNSDQWWYLVSLAVLVCMLWLARNLIDSRSGRAMIAIRDNPIAAAAGGIDVAGYKTATFAVSALLTGIAGGLSAVVVELVAPDSFTFNLAILFLIGSVVGGVASISGAVFGGAFVLFVPNLSEDVSKGLAGAVYGVFIIGVIFFMPQGLAGFAQKLKARLEK